MLQIPQRLHSMAEAASGAYATYNGDGSPMY
jgi:hypothetical protein